MKIGRNAIIIIGGAESTKTLPGRDEVKARRDKDDDMEPEKIVPYVTIGFFVLFFVLMFGCMISDFLFIFDIAPASGTATGYIYFTEKGGIWQLQAVCWKDTQYSDCEWFDPAGKTYEPGKYTMTYNCTTFVWLWEHPSECSIVNATRIGEIG